MTLKECYAAFGGNYEEVTGRLMGERLVLRFLQKFTADPSYQTLCDTIAAGNTEEAFRAAHTLKGVCQNLALDRLHDSSSAITEALRGGDLETAKTLLPQVTADYNETIAAISALS